MIGLDFSLRFLFSYPIQVYFGMLDALLASEALPEEYRDRCQVNKPFYIYFKLIDSFVFVY